MKVILEEIKKKHPAGSDPAGYRRVGLGEFFLDHIGDLPESTDDKLIWLGHELARTKPEAKLNLRGVVCLMRRTATAVNSSGAKEVVLLVDVCEPDVWTEIFNEITDKRYDAKGYDKGLLLNVADYIKWCKANEVW